MPDRFIDPDLSTSSTHGVTYEGIGLIITVYSAKGKLLGRGRTSVQPGVIGKGQVGYVDQFSIEIEKRKPARITWKVVSEGF